MKGFTGPTPLPADHLPSRQRDHAEHPHEQQLRLSAELTASLRRFARHEQITPNTLVQGAWSLLLSRYSGEEDVVFGTTLSGRSAPLPDIETMVGLFINTLPVRVRVTGDQTVSKWIRELHAQQVELQLYDYSPLVEIQGWGDVPRGLPMFESLLVFENLPSDSSLGQKTGSLGIRPVRRLLQQTGYPLGLVVMPGHEWVLKLVYDSSRLEAATVSQMLRHLQAALVEMTAHPDQRLANISLMNQAERQQVLVEWNATTTERLPDACIHQLVEAQVERTPDAIALSFGDQSLSYREFNRRANQLAHHLRGLGVRPEVRVGLYLERSLEMVIGVVGVLKADGAYVPLDPATPPDRLAFMLQDAQVHVLLTQSNLRARLARQPMPILCLDSNWSGVANQPGHNPESGAAAGSLAYVIYTSGSTGQPKGVLIEHRGLSNVVCDQIRTLDMGPDERVLQFVSLNFDAAQAEIFRALVAGATLCLAPAESLLPGPPLRDFLHTNAITLASLPPSVLAVMPEDSSLPALRKLVVAGEACPAELAAQWSQGRRLFNAYGPTETTICATIATDWDKRRPPPLGRPIANTQAYVLDGRLQPVPRGVVGELYLGGVGLARGYLHQPDLTTASFVPNPFSDQPGARLYKTGDLVRWGPDGNLHFVGRMDAQVKIRGYRVELGEIEAVLGQHPQVRQGVVAAREDSFGGRQLVGYVVPQQEPAPAVAELRRFVRAKLPEYMVPAAWVFLPHLPRLGNGKVDRRALPAAEPGLGRSLEPQELPRDQLEFQLVQIWEEVLGTQVGIRDNFFDLGGHSLLAVRLISRLEEHLGSKLPLAVLFQQGTVEELARLVRAEVEVPKDSPLVEIQPQGSKPPFFCVHPAGGNVFCYVPLSRRLGREQPFYGLKAPIRTGDEDSYSRLEEMAAHYVELMRTIQSAGPYYLGGWCTGGLVAFEIARQLSEQGERVALLALLETDFPAGPDREEGEADLAKLMTMFAKKRGLALSYETLAQLPPKEQAAFAMEQARRAHLTPAEIAGFAELPRLFGEFAPVAQANARLTRKYVLKPYADRLVFFKSSAGALRDDHPDPIVSWRRLVTDLAIYPVPGDHNTMLREPHVRVLAESLKHCLAERQATCTV
jgi:amino acid adenylation domain-containing protein